MGKCSTSLADGYLFGILEEIAFHLAVLMPLPLMATTNDNTHSTIDSHTPCTGVVYCCSSFERRNPFKGCQAIPLRSNTIPSSLSISHTEVPQHYRYRLLHRVPRPDTPCEASSIYQHTNVTGTSSCQDQNVKLHAVGMHIASSC